ncbi:MAG: 30S ribosomal protein S2 [Bacteroidota bacterium]
MIKTNFQELLEAGVHFGHLKRKWNPNMAPYIFMEKNGIHIIDLNKTMVKLDEAANAMKQIAKSGKKVLFVATKKQAKEIVSESAKSVNMPYITERWSGGMLTNFPTIRKAVKKMSSIDKMKTDGTFENISKRERLQITRQREKLETVLGSISEMSKLPAALFVVDVSKEKIAVAEAKRLHIPVFGIVDTNSDPSIDFPIPANDDASKSIQVVVNTITSAVVEGLNERKANREMEAKSRDQKTSAEVADKPVKRARKTKTTKEDVAPTVEDKTSEKTESEKPATETKKTEQKK